MTSTLRAIPGQPVLFPFSVQQLVAAIRSETGAFLNPNLPLSTYSVAPYFLFPCEEIPAPAPSNARTRRVEPVAPVRGEDGIWRQAWAERAATPEELAIFDQLNAPPPEWLGFQRALMGAASVNALLAACLSPQAAPLGGATIYGGLVVGLGQVAQGASAATFLEAWRGGMMAGLVTAELASEVARLAQPFNLPAEFLQGLLPPK